MDPDGMDPGGKLVDVVPRLSPGMTMDPPPRPFVRRASKRRMSKAQWTLEESVKPADNTFMVTKKSLRERLLEAKAQGAGLSIEENSLKLLCGSTNNPSLVFDIESDFNEFILPDGTSAESADVVDVNKTEENETIFVAIKEESNVDEHKMTNLITLDDLKTESDCIESQRRVDENKTRGIVTTNMNIASNSSNDTIVQCKAEKKSEFQIKLRNVELPAFNDTKRAWLKFMKEYNTQVYSQDISDKEKFHHLYNNLDKKARKLLDHLPMEDESLEKAIDILKHRYDRRTQINFNLDRIFNLPVYEESRDIGEGVLREVLKPVLEVREAIRQQGLTNWDHLYLHVTLSKLPPKLRDPFEIQYGSLGSDTNFTDLVVFLQQTCIKQEDVDYT